MTTQAPDGSEADFASASAISGKTAQSGKIERYDIAASDTPEKGEEAKPDSAVDGKVMKNQNFCSRGKSSAKSELL